MSLSDVCKSFKWTEYRMITHANETKPTDVITSLQRILCCAVFVYNATS